MAFSQKINLLLRERGMTKASLAKECGIPYTTLDSMLKRDSDSARLAGVFRIAEALGVTVEELVFDEETGKADVSPEEKRILSLFQALDGRGKDTVISLLEREAAICRRREEKLRRKSVPLCRIPVYQAPAAAGAALPVLTEEETVIEVTETDLPEGADFGIPISGDSMEPVIRDGEIVFVRTASEIGEGEVGIFLLNGESLCKKFHRDGSTVTLVSFNEKYRPIPVLETDDLKLVGKVLLSGAPRRKE